MTDTQSTEAEINRRIAVYEQTIGRDLSDSEYDERFGFYRREIEAGR